jgi:hypothetical protein
VANRTILARRHLLSALGFRRLAELTADAVDRWLARESGQVSTDTLAKLLSILMTSLEGICAPTRADSDAPAGLTSLHREAPSSTLAWGPRRARRATAVRFAVFLLRSPEARYACSAEGFQDRPGAVADLRLDSCSVRSHSGAITAPRPSPSSAAGVYDSHAACWVHVFDRLIPSSIAMPALLGGPAGIGYRCRVDRTGLGRR